MAELRRDPLSGRWVIMAVERASRPADFQLSRSERKATFCPFCAGNEDKTPPEIIALRSTGKGPDSPGWWVRVVANKYPALAIEGDLGKRGVGVYDMMNGVGAHEIIIETPEHKVSVTGLTVDHFADVLRVYRDRLLSLREDRRFIYGLLFKNVGAEAGASIEHTHSQLVCTPVVPKRVLDEMRRCEEFYHYRGRCLLCDIVRQEREDGQRVVSETERFICFTPFASRLPFELCIIPKQHSTHFINTDDTAIADLAASLHGAVEKIEGVLGNPPYNYIFHSSPFNVGELEYYHWHLELMPRLTRLAGFEWGTEFYINPMLPERAARYLRDVEKCEAPVELTHSRSEED